MLHAYTKEQIDRAYNDFRVFVWILWGEISLPNPTEIQLDICNTLQNPPSDRFIIEGFRGVAKSFLTCAYVVWQLWHNNQLKCMIVSASKDRADANAVFIKKIIFTLDFLQHLVPDKTQRDTQNLFDVGGAIPDISPSVKSVGITGQITGSRADILIADDVEVPNNSSTQTQRDKLSEAVREFDAILKPNGTIIYLGTPQCEMSLYNELQNRGYKCIIYPVLYPTNEKEREHYGNRLAPLIAQRYDNAPWDWSGKPTDPQRFNEEEIAKRKLSYGKAGFSLQFMLDTNLTDQEKYPLKVSDLIVADLDLEESSLKWSWASGEQQRIKDIPCVALKGDFFYAPFERSKDVVPYTGCCMAIDGSGRGKDETAYAIIKYLNGYLFVMEIGGLREGYSDTTLQYLANKAKFYGVNEVIIESNFGDGMFTQLIKPVLNKVHPCAVQEVRNSKQKELRIIDTLEPVMMRHKLIFNKSIITDDYVVYEKDYNYSLIYQMTRISKDKNSLAHDDRLDALTMAVAYWVAVMDRDAETGEEEVLEEWLERCMDEDKGIFWREDDAVNPVEYDPKKLLYDWQGFNILSNLRPR